MELKFSIKAVSVFSFLAGALFSFSALAGTRTVYFDQSAVASSINGFKTAQNARCRLVISNPSNNNQTFNITIYPLSTLPSSAAKRASTVSGTNDSTIFTTSGAPANAYVATISNVPQNTSYTYDFQYETFPLYNQPNGQNTDQQLSCRGTITVSDSNPANPGFAVANGMILTFSESSASQTMGSTSSTTAYVGSAVYTQIPMSINGGKPF